MAHEITMHNACSVACVLVFTVPPQQINTELRFGFVCLEGQEKLDFVSEE